MVIVDTTVWVDYLRGTITPQTAWLDLELERQRLGLTDLNLCEVLQGVKDERQAERVRGSLLRFAVIPTCGTELAVAAARNYRRLRAAGRKVRGTIDCLIATVCLTNSHSLLHNDHDFDHFERHLGLSVIHP